MVVALIGEPVLARAADSGTGPRYDLKRGDHLVYDQTIVRETRSQTVEQTTEGVWENHVLVLEEAAGSVRVGFQRNRTKLDLKRYRENGRDRLESEQPKFAALLAARPRAHAEANVLSDRGALRLPISAVRESRSDFLPFVRELLPLPASAVVGGPWDADAFGLPLRVAAEEERQGRRCLRIEGSRTVNVRLWICPEAGVLDGVELEGTYPQPGTLVKERITLRLRERRRGEEPAGWLDMPETRDGVLAALMTASVLPAGIASESIAPLLAGTDAGVVRRALGVFHRLSLPPPSLERLEPLAGSADPRTRALVARVLRNDSEPRSRATLERLQRDDDRFVADAARAQVPAEEATELRRVVAAVRGTGPLPEWRCGDAPDWPARAVRAQRSVPELPATTLRYTAEVGPYVLRVPEDYRGDEPFPLLLYFGGGPGRGVAAAQSAEDTVAATGYLVAYPDAVGGWWDKASVERVDRLLGHLRRVLNVDPNRVYLAGPSNGGTGTLLYASLWTDRLAAAAPLMSAGLRFFDPTGGISKVGLARVPLLFVHGTSDDILPVEGSKDAVAELRRESATAPVELRLLEGRGHDIRLGGDNGLTFPFFAAHDREPFSRDVAFETRGGSDARQRFVEVLEPGGGMARVAARIREGPVVDVDARRVKRLRLRLRRELLEGPGPLKVTLNGKPVFEAAVTEDCRLLLESWRALGDPYLAHSMEVDLVVK